MGKKLELLDDDDGEIKINKEFVVRYEHNKKREDLHRLEELKKKGVIDDDSESSSDEEDEVITASKKDDLKFLDALIKFRKQDPSLKIKDAKVFSSDSESDSDDNNNSKEKKKKPMYLKDVAAKQLIEEGADFEEEEDNEEHVKSYFEEQEDARKEFLKSLNEAENDENGEGELLILKENHGLKDEEDDEVIEEKLDEYFGKDEKLDENEMFLKEYFRNRMWEGNENGVNGINGINGDENLLELSDDEDAIEKQEDYERGFNFRFEENATDRVLGHSRKVEGSVRKKTNTRQLQRERKEERIAEADLERKEELKRLKNLKKKEMNEKLMKIRETAGIDKDNVSLLDINDLEDEFDPDEHDKKMKQAFGDDYYNSQDINPDFASDNDDFEKPDFDKEDEMLGLNEGSGFLSVREKVLKMKGDDVAEESEEGEEGDEVAVKEGKRKRKKRKESEVEKAIREELMEEYYKLDYEDTIGDLKTRFRYRPVKAKRFGLKTEEVLMMDDSELNQFVSIKKLAPYREKEWEVPHNKVIQQKELLRESVVKKGKRKRRDDDEKDKNTKETKEDKVKKVKKEKKKEKMEDEKEKIEELGENENKLSKGSKRRLRQAELKRRQMAYGLIPSKPKTKN